MTAVYAIAAAVFAQLLLGVVQWIQLGDAKAAGEAVVTAQADAAAVTTTTAIAQAEADAPTTRLALVDRLKAGTF